MLWLEVLPREAPGNLRVKLCECPEHIPCRIVPETICAAPGGVLEERCLKCGLRGRPVLRQLCELSARLNRCGHCILPVSPQRVRRCGVRPHVVSAVASCRCSLASRLQRPVSKSLQASTLNYRRFLRSEEGEKDRTGNKAHTKSTGLERYHGTKGVLSAFALFRWVCRPENDVLARIPATSAGPGRLCTVVGTC